MQRLSTGLRGQVGKELQDRIGKRVLKGGLESAAVEAPTEMLQEFNDILFEKYMQDGELSSLNKEDRNRLVDTLVSIPIGFLFGGAASVPSRKKPRKTLGDMDPDRTTGINSDMTLDQVMDEIAEMRDSGKMTAEEATAEEEYHTLNMGSSSLGRHQEASPDYTDPDVDGDPEGDAGLSAMGQQMQDLGIGVGEQGINVDESPQGVFDMGDFDLTNLTMHPEARDVLNARYSGEGRTAQPAGDVIEDMLRVEGAHTAGITQELTDRANESVRYSRYQRDTKLESLKANMEVRRGKQKDQAGIDHIEKLYQEHVDNVHEMYALEQEAAAEYQQTGDSKAYLNRLSIMGTERGKNDLPASERGMSVEEETRGIVGVGETKPKKFSEALHRVDMNKLSNVDADIKAAIEQGDFVEANRRLSSRQPGFFEGKQGEVIDYSTIEGRQTIDKHPSVIVGTDKDNNIAYLNIPQYVKRNWKHLRQSDITGRLYGETGRENIPHEQMIWENFSLILQDKASSDEQLTFPIFDNQRAIAAAKKKLDALRANPKGAPALKRAQRAYQAELMRMKLIPNSNVVVDATKNKKTGKYDFTTLGDLVKYAQSHKVEITQDLDEANDMSIQMEGKPEVTKTTGEEDMAPHGTDKKSQDIQRQRVREEKKADKVDRAKRRVQEGKANARLKELREIAYSKDKEVTRADKDQAQSAIDRINRFMGWAQDPEQVANKYAAVTKALKGMPLKDKRIILASWYTKEATEVNWLKKPEKAVDAKLRGLAWYLQKQFEGNNARRKVLSLPKKGPAKAKPRTSKRIRGQQALAKKAELEADITELQAEVYKTDNPYKYVAAIRNARQLATDIRFDTVLNSKGQQLARAVRNAKTAKERTAALIKLQKARAAYIEADNQIRLLDAMMMHADPASFSLDIPTIAAKQHAELMEAHEELKAKPKQPKKKATLIQKKGSAAEQRAEWINRQVQRGATQEAAEASYAKNEKITLAKEAYEAKPKPKEHIPTRQVAREAEAKQAAEDQALVDKYKTKRFIGLTKAEKLRMFELAGTKNSVHAVRAWVAKRSAQKAKPKPVVKPKPKATLSPEAAALQTDLKKKGVLDPIPQKEVNCKGDVCLGTTGTIMERLTDAGYKSIYKINLSGSVMESDGSMRERRIDHYAAAVEIDNKWYLIDHPQTEVAYAATKKATTLTWKGDFQPRVIEIKDIPALYGTQGNIPGGHKPTGGRGVSLPKAQQVEVYKQWLPSMRADSDNRSISKLAGDTSPVDGTKVHAFVARYEQLLLDAGVSKAELRLAASAAIDPKQLAAEREAKLAELRSQYSSPNATPADKAAIVRLATDIMESHVTVEVLKNITSVPTMIDAFTRDDGSIDHKARAAYMELVDAQYRENLNSDTHVKLQDMLDNAAKVFKGLKNVRLVVAKYPAASGAFMAVSGRLQDDGGVLFLNIIVYPKAFKVVQEGGFKKIASIMIHEIGHLVEFTYYQAASAETKMAIHDAFINAAGPFTNAESLTSAGSQHAIGSAVQGVDLDFSEWFAEQVNAWVQTDKKAEGLVETFFKGLADYLKRIYQQFISADKAFVKVHPTIDSFMSSIMYATPVEPDGYMDGVLDRFKKRTAPVMDGALTDYRDEYEAMLKKRGQAIDYQTGKIHKNIAPSVNTAPPTLSSRVEDLIKRGEFAAVAAFIADGLNSPVRAVRATAMRAALDHFYSPEEKAVLYRAFTTGRAIKQLKQYLNNDMVEFHQLNPDNMIVQSWLLHQDGLIDIGPKAERQFADAYELASLITGVVTESKQAEQLLTEITNAQSDVVQGKYANPTPRVFGKHQLTDNAIQKSVAVAREAFNDYPREAYRRLAKTGYKRLNRSGNPYVRQIADKFHPEWGRKVKATHHEAVLNLTNKYANTLHTALNGLSKAQLDVYGKHMRAGTNTEVAVGATLSQEQRTDNQNMQHAIDVTREMIQALYKYQKQVNPKLGKIEDNYFPVSWDLVSVVNNEQLFLSNVEQLKRKKIQALSRIISNTSDKKVRSDATSELKFMKKVSGREIINMIIRNDGLQETDRMKEKYLQTPFNGAEMGRVWKFLSDKEGRKLMESFQETNATITMGHYIKAVVRKTEFARRFGVSGEHLEDLLKKAEEFGLNKETDKGERAEITRYIEGQLGITGYKVDPKIRKGMGWVITAMNVALLPLVVTSSVPEILNIALRSRGDTAAMKAGYQQGAREIIHGLNNGPIRNIMYKAGLTDKPASARRTAAAHMAETLGVIQSSMSQEILTQLYANSFLTGQQQKANDWFFTSVGIEAWTRMTRTMATTSAIEFIKNNAGNKEWMSELGLFDGDVIIPTGTELAARGSTAPELDILSSSEYMRMQARDTAADRARIKKSLRIEQAINRWVNQSMMRPGPAIRPMWFNDPRFMLFSYLQDFQYAMLETTLRQMAYYIRGNGGFKGLEGASVPWVGGATAIAVAAAYAPVFLVGELLRDFIQHGGDDDPRKKGWGMQEHLEYGFKRSGMYGPAEKLLDIKNDDIPRHRLPIDTLGGPVAGKTVKLYNAAISTREWSLANWFAGMSPYQAIWKPWT